MKLKKLEEGLELFEKSIDIRTNLGLGDRITLLRDKINLGSLHFEALNLEESEQYLLAALKIIEKDYQDYKADLGQIYWSLTQLYKTKKDLTLAYENYRKCESIFKDIYPNDHPLQEKIDNLLIELELMKGAELYKKEEYSNSLEHLLFVVSKKPTFKIVSEGETMSVFQFIGSCYYQLEDYKKAIEAEKKAIDVYPEYELDNYYNAIGLSYFKIYEFDEAKNAFEKYLKVAPEEWRPYRNLALYHAEIKNADLALNYLERAIAFGFDDKKWLKMNKSFENLRSNDGYKKLLKSIR